MQVSEICTRNVIQCARDTTALELAQIMGHSHVGTVVVVDKPNGERFPVGIVTDRDLVINVMAREDDPAVVTAADIMSADLITTGERIDVYDAIELMRFKGVRRLPVVGEDGQLAGIVALEDLLKLVGDELTLLGRVINSERLKEQEPRR